MRRWWILGGAVMAVAVGGMAVSRPRELSFMDKYTRFDASASGLKDDRYRPANWLFGRKPGGRIFSWKGDYAAVAAEMRRELAREGWSEKALTSEIVLKNGGGYSFKKGRDTILLLNARSVISSRPSRGRSVVFESTAAKAGMKPEDVRGWVNIDHHWSGVSGVLFSFAPAPVTPTVPARPASKP